MFRHHDSCGVIRSPCLREVDEASFIYKCLPLEDILRNASFHAMKHVENKFILSKMLLIASVYTYNVVVGIHLKDSCTEEIYFRIRINQQQHLL